MLCNLEPVSSRSEVEPGVTGATVDSSFLALASSQSIVCCEDRVFVSGMSTSLISNPEEKENGQSYMKDSSTPSAIDSVKDIGSKVSHELGTLCLLSVSTLPSSESFPCRCLNRRSLRICTLDFVLDR